MTMDKEKIIVGSIFEGPGYGHFDEGFNKRLILLTYDDIDKAEHLKQEDENIVCVLVDMMEYCGSEGGIPFYHKEKDWEYTRTQGNNLILFLPVDMIDKKKKYNKEEMSKIVPYPNESICEVM